MENSSVYVKNVGNQDIINLHRRQAMSKEYEKAGELLIKVLQLKKKKNGRVATAWGDKTPLGLALTVERVLFGTPPSPQEGRP